MKNTIRINPLILLRKMGIPLLQPQIISNKKRIPTYRP
jgi:hypothetical protein